MQNEVQKRVILTVIYYYSSEPSVLNFADGFRLFLVEAWKWRVLKHRRRLCLIRAASVSPFSVTSFVGRCVANFALSRDHCSPPQASSSFYATFVVLPPSFVSPKTACLQLAIDPELYMDVFMDSVLAFSTTLRWFRAWHNPLYIETARCVHLQLRIYEQQ